MKNKTSVVLSALLLLTATLALAQPKPKSKSTAETVPAFPGTLTNARYVYITSYDGDEFDRDLLSADREAIVAVQDALKKWGKFTIVYKPQDADIVMMVTSRPSEDVLAVYDGHGWPKNGQYLWRMTSRNGLQSSETPLVTNLQTAFEQAVKK